MEDRIINLRLGLEQTAEAIGCSAFIIDKLFNEGRTGNLVINEGAGAKKRLKVRFSDLDDLKAVVEEHGRRSRQVKTANGAIIMNKMDALARAVNRIGEEMDVATTEAVTAILVSGGFDLSIEKPQEAMA